ncbi:MAG: hypothetical protein OEQ74_00025 [Gammaproteobacteria bacterium]|nr:hypothetical protein [Gammaproteobacteria bacterium]
MTSLLFGANAETPLAACVRSPWAYYHLSRALAAGGNPASDYGNEALPSLRSLTIDPMQWDWGSWSGDGSQRGLEVPWTSDPVGLDAVASTGFGALLIGVAIFHPLSVSSTETIISIGSRRESVAGIENKRVELKLNKSDRANLTVWDDLGIQAAATINQPGVSASGPDAGPVALFVFIDNRPGGPQTASIHQYELGTANRVSKVQSIAALGSITGGATVDPDKVLSVGFSPDIGSATFRHYNGALRGLHVMNFGDKPPSDIDFVMDQLSRTAMMSGRFMVGL